MTAAATDGSTDDSTSERLAVLTSPAIEEAGERRQQRRDDVQREQHLPDADAGQPGRDRVVADREEQPAVPAPAEPEDDQDRDRDEQEQAVRQEAEAGLGAEPLDGGGICVPDWTIASW